MPELVDCLTKPMDPMVMTNSMKMLILSLAAAAESKLLKLRKEKLRENEERMKTLNLRMH